MTDLEFLIVAGQFHFEFIGYAFQCFKLMV